MKQNPERRPKIVADNIRKIREFRNYTQEYIAMKLNISQNAYSKLELGYSKISIDRLFQIAELLEVDAGELVSYESAELLQLFKSPLNRTMGQQRP
ncbi:helix-turn-helix domain-containing protein [Pedobacter sp. BAL39]|uniref:helix-turn-helix domain-containing protein n=1 Tax=Pedobacter sp. BAL39 TaxID=391596 RepID=UPI00067FE82F|nr:helix-turn-helix transcriptional regulator [Pedobacter sp. BAL39]